MTRKVGWMPKENTKSIRGRKETRKETQERMHDVPVMQKLSNNGIAKSPWESTNDHSEWKTKDPHGRIPG